MKTVNVVQVGCGAVGKALVALMAQRNFFLRKNLGIELKLLGIFSSKKYIFDDRGLPLDGADRIEGVFDEGKLYQGWEKLEENIEKETIVVDATAAPIAEMHQAILRSGGIVVTANKKPLTDKLGIYRELHADTGRYFYETTVGSSTPVIQTLQDLVKTGDEVREIKATPSGTLGFVCSELGRGELKFSEIVKKAKELGYTEPHPRDDLLGLDVARKALILGREIGLLLEMTDIKLEGMISNELAEIEDVPIFLEKLKILDKEYDERMAEWKAREEAPQFVARIKPEGISVGLVGVKSNESLGRLTGPENFISFRTRIFNEAPLVLQGKGAGVQYTAEGVLQDIIRASQ